MNRHRSDDQEKAWAFVDRERRMDRFLKAVNIVAWSVTLFVVLIFAVFIGAGVVEMARGAAAGQVPWSAVAGSMLPIVVVLGLLSVLIATLTTIMIFLRLRTASLTEIQLRLAALENMMTSTQEAEGRE